MPLFIAAVMLVIASASFANGMYQVFQATRDVTIIVISFTCTLSSVLAFLSFCTLLILIELNKPKG